MSTTTTPYMNLEIPVVGVEPGPTYATDVNQAFTDVDAHDHSTGFGKKISPNGININADLNANGYSFYNFLATKYSSQNSSLASSNTSCVYSVAGNLYWNNGSGTAIQITSGTGLNLASVGTIGGDYGAPGITASVVYTNSIKTFAFTQSSGVSAKMAMGDIALTNPTSGVQAVTLKASASTAAYDFTFPTAAPGSTLPLSVNTSGQALLAQITLAQLASAVQEALCPVGTILPYGGATAPSGWLVCNGDSVLKATYASLYSVIGDAFGTVDATHFTLPDFRGLFMRGWDNGAGRDPDASSRVITNTGGNTGDNIGSYQDDEFESMNNRTGASIAAVNFNSNTGRDLAFGGPYSYYNFGSIGGTETRSKNVYVNYIVKY